MLQQVRVKLLSLDASCSSICNQLSSLLFFCYTHQRLDKSGRPSQGEWTTLAGIVEGKKSSSINGGLSDYCVVALSTGTKCVTGKDATLSNVIVDCHAESLLKRAFKRYLIAHLAKNQPIHLESYAYHLFISQLPCGTIERYKGARGTNSMKIKYTHTPRHLTFVICVIGLVTNLTLPVYQLDTDCLIGLRRKPGRGESCAKPSCVDKLAKWVRVGFQGEKLIAFTKKRIEISSIHIGNCVEHIEFDQRRLKSALVETAEGSRTDTGNSPKAKRLKTTASDLLFPDRTDIDIVFCEDFRQVELTRTNSRKACPSAVVAWRESKSSLFHFFGLSWLVEILLC